MKPLNELIERYTACLQQGEIQIAYKGILGFVGKLRAALIKKYPQYEVSSVYQGFMDMSYFSLNPTSLKDRGLKIAIVYLHEKAAFEVWLSARNKDIARDYKSIFKPNNASHLSLFHDENNPDAIVEYPLTSTPSFDDQALLIETIDQALELFIGSISERLSVEI